MRFLIRVLPNRLRKAEARKRQAAREAAGRKANPFLPYDKDLFVANLSDSHVCLLNKFNVVDHHLLVVTRVFEDQKAPLSLRDFEAIWICLRDFEGLAFYNAGKEAGASQPHKHLQYVPLPMTPDGPRVPVEPLLTGAVSGGAITASPRLPFPHAAVGVESLFEGAPDDAPPAALGFYRRMLKKTSAESRPYNLLATRRWMLLVPRTQECFSTISVNALGFAGSLFARNKRERDLLRGAGPMTVLKTVAG